MTSLGRFAAAALLVAGLAVPGPITAPGAPVTAGVDLAATALYMGGTGHPLSIPQDSTSYIQAYVNWAYNDFVGPSGLCTGGDPGCAQSTAYGPQQFWPITGLTNMTFDQSVPIGLANLNACLRGMACVVTDAPFTTTGTRVLTDTAYTVFGYSQSGAIASLQKSDLIAHPPAGAVSFVFVSNPNRPNGGVLERFVGAYIPLLDVTFNGATVTNSPQPTPLTTVDVVHQYDPVADFPTNPLNLLADLNALMGFYYEHPEEGAGTPVLQGQFQDTTYYLIPTVSGELPLIRPLNLLPFLGPLLATVVDPPLRVLVEAGYDRSLNPGAPTPAKWLYVPNPIATTANFLAAIPTGWDNGIAHLTGDPANRPFGTAPQGPYGVGGPPVDAGAVDPYGPPTPLGAVASLSSSARVAEPRVALSEEPRSQRSSGTLRGSSITGERTPAATHTVADSRSATPKRSAASSTEPLRRRAWSAQ